MTDFPDSAPFQRSDLSNNKKNWLKIDCTREFHETGNKSLVSLIRDSVLKNYLILNPEFEIILNFNIFKMKKPTFDQKKSAEFGKRLK